jgi:hypothetical protein
MKLPIFQRLLLGNLNAIAGLKLGIFDGSGFNLLDAVTNGSETAVSARS